MKKLVFSRVGVGHYQCKGDNFDAHIWKAPKGLGVWAWCIFRAGTKMFPKNIGQKRGVAYSLEWAKFDIRESVAGRRTVYS